MTPFKDKIDALVMLCGKDISTINDMRVEQIKNGANQDDLVLCVPGGKLLGMKLRFDDQGRCEVINASEGHGGSR